MTHPKTEYVSVIGSSLIDPIVKLAETLESLGLRGPNEVQASSPENGYSSAIVALCVFLVESALNRTKYICGGQQKRANLAFFQDQFPCSGLGEKLKEILVLRDVIAHNHLWEAQVEWDDTGLRFSEEPQLQPLYGDNKFRDVLDEGTRKSRLLGLNLFPARVCCEDVIIVLHCVYEVLLFLESKDRRYFCVSDDYVEFRGQFILFGDFVNQFSGSQH